MHEVSTPKVGPLRADLLRLRRRRTAKLVKALSEIEVAEEFEEIGQRSRLMLRVPSKGPTPTTAVADAASDRTAETDSRPQEGPEPADRSDPRGGPRSAPVGDAGVRSTRSDQPPNRPQVGESSEGKQVGPVER